MAGNTITASPSLQYFFRTSMQGFTKLSTLERGDGGRKREGGSREGEGEGGREGAERERERELGTACVEWVCEDTHTHACTHAHTCTHTHTALQLGRYCLAPILQILNYQLTQHQTLS